MGCFRAQTCRTAVRCRFPPNANQSTGEVRYRRAGDTDAGAIASLFRTTRQTCLPYLPVLHTADEDVAFFSARVLAHDTVWVAERAGRIVGFCAFGNGWLNHLYIDKDSQRSGIGSELLDIAARENDTLTLWVFQKNLSAIRFYESHGFRLIATTDGAENEERMPDALYRRAPMVSLQHIDDKTLDDLLAVAVTQAVPDEVIAPVPGPAGWIDARRAAFRAYHIDRRGGLAGPLGEATFAIVLGARVVGSARLKRTEPGTLETGMWLARGERGRGLGSEVLMALKRQAAAGGAARMIAQTSPKNRNAIRTLRNCGATINEPDEHGRIWAAFHL